MSIIYEALKKVEQSGTKKPLVEIKPKAEKKDPWIKNIIIYCLIIAVGVFLANALLRFISRPRQIAKPALAPPLSPVIKRAPPVVPDKEPPFVQQPEIKFSDLGFSLNGVFYSGQEAYALLNNQIIRVGDEVGGAQVKRISLEGVELEKDGQLIVIPAVQ
jgi:hypothetical protein